MVCVPKAAPLNRGEISISSTHAHPEDLPTALVLPLLSDLSRCGLQRRNRKLSTDFIICLFPSEEFVYMILLNLHGWGTKYLS